ncbi:MAG: hypothetical protein OXN27_09410 [Candidatus Poribacteria bacterium]|nr:hypothetical protein [Candidatus Poribacteria bacterium]
MEPRLGDVFIGVYHIEIVFGSHRTPLRSFLYPGQRLMCIVILIRMPPRRGLRMPRAFSRHARIRTQ